jgi:hypothetical protein
MLFGLTNASPLLIDMMNNVFHDYLGQFTVVFIEDILIYSKSQEEHEVRLRKFLGSNSMPHLRSVSIGWISCPSLGM